MNNDLYNNTYQIPANIIKKITAKLYTTPTGDGVKRAKYLINNKSCTYQELKRLKNFFDSYQNHGDSKYELAGGDEMKQFVEHTLATERDKVERTKDIKRPVKSSMNNSGLSIGNLAKVNLKENEEVGSDLSLNSVVMIFDDEMRILMLKRSSYPDQWQPNKWSLPGGMVEKGEDPSVAAIREVQEETGIKLDKLIEKFVIQRNDNNVEHLFISKLPPSHKRDDVTLDKENDGYAWVRTDEIKDLDTVPNVMDYIRIAAEKYE